MIDIGIIGAMKDEVDGIIARLQEKKCETVGSVKFYTGTLFGKRIVICGCGIGKVFAALATEAMIVTYAPRLIVNTGVGGALAEGLSTTDIVLAERLVQHDMDTSALGDPKGMVSGINRIYFEADTRAIKILSAAASDLGLNATVGTVASGDKFIASREDRERIVRDFGADACEMEGCAIAQVAYVNDTPFAVVRAISDSADTEATMDYPAFLSIAAKNSTSLTLQLIKNY